MANAVTLTFAGETRSLEDAFKRADQAAESFGESGANASRRMAEGFDHLSSQSSLLSGGIGDVGGALTEAFGDDTAIGQFGAKMESASAVVMGFTGVMDLGVFATNNLKLASAAQAVQAGVTAAATKVWAGAQWLMNTALFASPITWIVVGIVALVAVIVIIATKTNWFGRLWRATWAGITAGAKASWNFIKQIPGWIGTAFGKVARFISAPYRAAFNLIADAWNNTIGRLSWSVPGWVPGIGGNSISVPNLPHFHAGGVVGGVRGTPQVALLQGGERVVSDNGGGGGQLVIRSDGSKIGDLLVDVIATAVRRRGGGPDQLGIRLAGA